MRVAIVAPEYPPDPGGMERYAWEVANGLCGQGFTVTVFTKKGAKRDVPSCRAEVVPCLVGSHTRDRQIFASRSKDFDIWHVMNAAWAWITCEVRPVFLSIHGNDFLDPNPVVRLELRDRFKLPFGSRLDFHIAKWLTARTLTKAIPRLQHVFANSNATEALFVNRYPCGKSKTSVAWVGVSDFFLRSRPRATPREGPPRLITVCRLNEPRKNVDVVLRALARLKDEHDFRYTIVGDGPLRQCLEQLACALDLGDRVEFLGQCSDERVRDQLLGSDLFILTSSASRTSIEGFGIVYLEANACGVPVLAARAGGAVDAVAEGDTGLFVDSPTPGAIAEVLRDFLSGKKRFKVETCRAFAQKFSWPKVLERIIGHYTQAAPKDLASQS